MRVKSISYLYLSRCFLLYYIWLLLENKDFKYDFSITEVEIVGEGSKVHKHTSAILDLKTRAFELGIYKRVPSMNSEA